MLPLNARIFTSYDCYSPWLLYKNKYKHCIDLFKNCFFSPLYSKTFTKNAVFSSSFSDKQNKKKLFTKINVVVEKFLFVFLNGVKNASLVPNAINVSCHELWILDIAKYVALHTYHTQSDNCERVPNVHTICATVIDT